ncbi:hypothetical protein [Streptomyces sp. NBC_00063]|uniref:hypothetical protein n=1 Tax=Streptomyces sp. NBC_00063 TaxID=2975638 RepID=UPI003D74D922
MITHTLVYSFADTFTKPDRQAFFAELGEIFQGSELVESFDYRMHVPLPTDDHAPVFVASAVAWIRCADSASLEAVSAQPELVQFKGRWQKKSPYRVVWVNYE